jgi:RimJ/RimL family protein N-acetyltransferase
MEPRSERLWLRQWRASDLEPFARLNADPVAMEFFPTLLSRAESDAMVQRLTSEIREQGWGRWAVELLESGQFIGFVGLCNTPSDLPIAPCVEVGWRIDRSYWGHGYATEAARAALAVAFHDLKLKEIVSFTAVLNRRSRAVMERLGMIESPETFEHPRVPIDSPLRTHCLYRLSQAQWRA